MAILKNGIKQSLYKGDNKPINLYKGAEKAAGWINSAKEGEAAEWEETYDDYLDGTINGFSTQANPYYREEENTSIVVTENQDAALEKCEINGVSSLVNAYEASEGLSELENDYVGKDGVSTQQFGVWGTNLIQNGDFSDGVTGWTAGGGTLSASNNVLSNIANGTNNYPYQSYLGTLIIGHKYLVVVSSRVTNSDCTVIQYKFDNNNQYYFQSNPVINQWYRVCMMITAETTSMTLRLHNNYVDNATALGKVMETKYVLVIDITKEFGTGTQPTAAQMDTMLSKHPNSWFNGKALLTTDTTTYTANSPSPDYPSTILNTKNLCNYRDFIRHSTYAVPTVIQDGINLSGTWFVLLPITTLMVGYYYTMSWVNEVVSGDVDMYWRVEYSDMGYSQMIYNGQSIKILDSVVNILLYINKLSIVGETNVTNIQLELSSTATTYEPFIGAGSYKITDGSDIYEFTLTDDIRGIGSVQDRVVFDRINHVGWLDGKIKHILLSESFGWGKNEQTYKSHGWYFSFTLNQRGNSQYTTVIKCNRFSSNGNWGTYNNVFINEFNNFILTFTQDIAIPLSLQDFKIWLTNNQTEINYPLETPTRTTITFTKVTTSTLPEFPASALTVTQSPSYPYTISPYVAAGTYKITTNNGIYETTLADDMRGVGDYKDKIVFDSYNGKGWRETKIYKKVFDGSESISFGGSMTTTSMFLYGAVYAPSLPVGDYIDITKTNHFNNVLNYSTDVEGCFINHVKILYFRINSSRLSSLDSSGVKAWLTAEYTAGRPVTTIYPLATPTRTNLTFTKVTSSSAPELPSSILSTGSGRNKFNKDTVTVDKVIDNTNGVLWNSTVNNVTPFIPVSASQYTISGHTYVQSGSVGLAWYTSANAYISGTTFNTVTGNGTYTRPETAAYVRYTVNDVDLATSQLEAGGVANPYESYFTPNVPNPNYPVSITSVDEPTLSTYKKNLFDKNMIDNLLNYYLNSNGTVSISSTEAYSVTGFIMVKSLTQYVQNISGNSAIYACYYDKNKNFISSQALSLGTIYLNTPVSCIYLRTTVKHSAGTFETLQIEEGSTATPYEPYQGVTLPYTTAPLYSLSASIYDKLNVLRGKERHNIGVKVFDGTESGWSGAGSWGNRDGYNTLAFYRYIDGTNGGGPTWNFKSEGLITSSHLLWNVASGFLGLKVGLFTSGSTYIVFRIPRGFLPTWSMDLTDTERNNLFMAYLASEYAKGTPVTVIYQLATPTESAQTSQAVPLYSPLTNIFTDKGKVKVGYKLKDSTVKVETDIIAPHPDYKSDILSAGGNMVSRGRNLWIPFAPNSINGVVLSVGSKGQTILNGTCTSSANFRERRTINKGTYTLKANANQIPINDINALIQIYEPDIVEAYISNNNAVLGSFSFTVINTALVDFRIRIQQGVTYDNFTIKPQLELGSTAHPYLPYHAPTQIVLPTLRAIKLAPTAVDQNYTDASGNKYCADTLTYLGNGVYEHVQRVKRVVFNGTENWTASGASNITNTVSFGAFLSLIDSVLGYDGVSGWCSHGGVGNSTNAESIYSGFIYNPSNTGHWLKFIRAVASDIVSFKAFLAAEYARGTPVTVDYILATPIVTQLTLGELKTFPHYTAVEQDGSTKTFMNLSAKVQDYTI